MEHPQSFKLKTFTQTRATIMSVGTFLPKQIVKSDDIFDEIKSEQQYGIPRDFMSNGMGIIERRMAAPEVEPSDLAIAAAENALAACPDVRRKDIGLVIFCGIERDHPEPATAHTIQNALGVRADDVFDVANACLGFIDGVKIASQYIAAGIVRYALVVTGEVSTRVTRSLMQQLEAGMDLKKAQNLLGGLSVGDAGGAVVLGPSEHTGFALFNNSVDSTHVDKCIYKTGDNGVVDGQMLMAKILAHGIKMHRNLLDHTMRRLGWEQFDWVLSHQTGKRNFQAFEKMLGIDQSRMVKTYERYGNTTTATLPLGWETLMNSGKVMPGDKVGGLFAGSGLSTCQFGLVC